MKQWYQRRVRDKCRTLLHLVPKTDPILHKRTTPVSFPLSKDVSRTVQNMLYSIKPEQLRSANASFFLAAGMAANQWGIDQSIFLIQKKVDQYVPIFNPSYLPLTQDTEEEWEGCFSIPMARGLVRRYKKISVTWQTQDGTRRSNELTGYLARVWQHETDHLNGFLYDNPEQGKCTKFCTFCSREEEEAFTGDI
eukprot:TRINITY_DN4826_c0_g1_i9.p1 TRINITY_DN4826_c0_g1~~TRINITY_DN4826_c0_g1_i9.p1  ORF type:complete len:194 (+),score=28.83 TRINITY_DN4826_c0_g1_i9:22-603(+)